MISMIKRVFILGVKNKIKLIKYFLSEKILFLFVFVLVILFILRLILL